MRKVKLNSGKELGVAPAPFSDSFKLFQAFMGEMKGLNFSKDYSSQFNIMKDLLSHAITSPAIEERLWECMKRCTYGGLKIEPALFETPQARAEFLSVCMEVAAENLGPFTKDLYASFDRLLTLVPNEKSPS